ncbi:MAG TPA: hypothetical protein VFX02_12025 [Gammaproteobacteria bacterium]|nr:hypothetical protein [Gammaproteobacteria bacterium]
MSETAEYRSKRRFCSYLKDNPWQWQYTVFYTFVEEGQKAIEHGKALRRLLAAKYTSQPFLWRLCLKIVPTIYFDDEADYFDPRDVENNHSVPRVVMPFHTLFTTEKLRYTPLFQNISMKINSGIWLKNRRVSPYKVERYCRAVMLEKPHDLKKFFGDKKINRFSLINRASLPE